MAGKSVTRADLSDAASQKVGLSQDESAELVQQVIEEICETLGAGETVKLSGFGSFIVRNKAERMGRNPKTGAEVPITPRQVIMSGPRPFLRLGLTGKSAIAPFDFLAPGGAMGGSARALT
jgi:integration host factor subunit alpha